MNNSRDYRPEGAAVNTKPLAEPDGFEFSNPRFWYAQKWYYGVLFGLGLYAVSAAFVGLWALIEFQLFLTVSWMIGVVGTFSISGGLASLFRKLFGERLPKLLILSLVITIIVLCSTFLTLAIMNSRVAN